MWQNAAILATTCKQLGDERLMNSCNTGEALQQSLDALYALRCQLHANTLIHSGSGAEHNKDLSDTDYQQWHWAFCRLTVEGFTQSWNYSSKGFIHLGQTQQLGFSKNHCCVLKRCLMVRLAHSIAWCAEESIWCYEKARVQIRMLANSGIRMHELC